MLRGLVDDDPSTWARARRVTAGYAVLLTLLWLGLVVRALLQDPGLALADAALWLAVLLSPAAAGAGLALDHPLLALAGAGLLALVLGVSTQASGPISPLLWPAYAVLVVLVAVVVWGSGRAEGAGAGGGA